MRRCKTAQVDVQVLRHSEGHSLTAKLVCSGQSNGDGLQHSFLLPERKISVSLWSNHITISDSNASTKTFSLHEQKHC